MTDFFSCLDCSSNVTAIIILLFAYMDGIVVTGRITFIMIIYGVGCDNFLVQYHLKLLFIFKKKLEPRCYSVISICECCLHGKNMFVIIFE
jgi:hypothetical protein